MKLQFLSDIHLEFFNKNLHYFDFLINVKDPSCQYLALLGDIGHPSIHNYSLFLNHIHKYYRKIFIISGNHEYYSNNSPRSITHIDKHIHSICNQFSNVFYLNNDYHILNDDYVIIGSTLWSNIDLDFSNKIQHSLNDYKNIYDDKLSLVTPSYIRSLFNRNVQFIIDTLKLFPNKKIIILSHHLPSLDLIDSKYKSAKYSDFNSAYASDLNYLFYQFNNIHYWLCGHTHSSIDTKINNTRILCNPCGYLLAPNVFENKNFSTHKFIEL
mgnify:CR=1 FL=1